MRSSANSRSSAGIEIGVDMVENGGRVGRCAGIGPSADCLGLDPFELCDDGDAGRARAESTHRRSILPSAPRTMRAADRAADRPADRLAELRRRARRPRAGHRARDVARDHLPGREFLAARRLVPKIEPTIAPIWPSQPPPAAPSAAVGRRGCRRDALLQHLVGGFRNRSSVSYLPFTGLVAMIALRSVRRDRPDPRRRRADHARAPPSPACRCLRGTRPAPRPCRAR